jgi:ABC-type Fe3+-citrate transport system substrate-binding protein
MKKISSFIVVFLFLANTSLYSQKVANKDNYTAQIQEEEGDLNKDKHNDRIVVEMDVKDDTRPLRVQIFLSNQIRNFN